MKQEGQVLAEIFGEKYEPSEREIQMGDKSIRIQFCGLCDGFYIECPRCGNNCCNAGAGKEEDGETQCTMCLKAYELQDILSKHDDLIEELLKNGRNEKDREAHKSHNFGKGKTE
jgi:hypothetical protein